KVSLTLMKLYKKLVNTLIVLFTFKREKEDQQYSSTLNTLANTSLSDLGIKKKFWLTMESLDSNQLLQSKQNTTKSPPQIPAIFYQPFHSLKGKQTRVRVSKESFIVNDISYSSMHLFFNKVLKLFSYQKGKEICHVAK